MPVSFCPICANILFPLKKNGRMYLTCTLDPHSWPIKKIHKVIYKYASKEVDQETHSEANSATGPQTEINCPKCDNTQAYYEQMQTRSADEPMTIFYRCTSTKCKHTWKE